MKKIAMIIGLLIPFSVCGIVKSEDVIEGHLSNMDELITALNAISLSSVTGVTLTNYQLAVAASTNSILMGASTAYAPALATAQSTATLTTRSNNLDSSTATLTTAINSTATTLTNFQNAVNSSTNTLPALTTGTVGDLLTSRLSGGASTYASFDAVVNATGTSIVISTGTTGNLSPTRLVGGTTHFASFNAVVASTGMIQRAYTVVVGTLGAIGVDVASNTVNGYIQALALCGVTQNAMTSSTGCTILYRPGVYSGYFGSTIPTNVAVMAVPNSSTVLNWGSLSQPMFASYGTISGFDIDVGGVAFTGALLQLLSNSITKDIVVHNAHGMATGAGVANATPGVFKITNSSNVLVDNFKVDFFTTRTDIAIEGDSGNFYVFRSTNVTLNRLDLSTGTGSGAGITAGGSTTLGIRSCSNVKLTNSIFRSAGGRCIRIMGSKGTVIDNNDFIKQTSGINPLIGVANDSVNCTTPTIISNNRVDVQTSNGTNIFGFDAAASNTVRGVLVNDNYVFSSIGLTASEVFLNIGSTKVVGAVIKGNVASNIATFISDSGTGTQYATLGNFLNSVQQ